MTIELLQRLSMIAYVLAVVLFVIAVVLFFVLKIPVLFGELTGATARKGVEAIRQQTLNGESPTYLAKKAKGRKQQRASEDEAPKKIGRKDETVKLDTAMLSQHAAAQGTGGADTVLLGQTAPAFDSGETVPLYGNTPEADSGAEAGETAVLFAPTQEPMEQCYSGETAMLYQPAQEPMGESDIGETATLYYRESEPEIPADAGETTMLSWANTEPEATAQNDSVTLDVEMGFLGSSELIE